MRELPRLAVERFEPNPLITPSAGDIGSNINGPSVVRVPEWAARPLGEYYLYFAHHHGESIRLAYADELRGPWTVHPPGVLQLDETRFDGHIASPDVHVDHEAERFRLYFHGCCGPFEHPAGPFSQVTDVATGPDGRSFSVQGTGLGNSYFRVWEHDGTAYGLANDGHLYRSVDPLGQFEQCQELFPRNRHFAVRRRGQSRLDIVLTRRGDRPERIQVATMALDQPVGEWRADPHPPETVMWPSRTYEGGDQPLTTSEDGAADGRIRALRDPAIYEEDGATYLFYAIAGERGIAGAQLRTRTCSRSSDRG